MIISERSARNRLGGLMGEIPAVRGPSRRYLTPFSRWGWLLLLLATSGASCPRGLHRPLVSSPAVFAALPSGDQVRDFLLQQSARVQTVQTTGAQLHVPGAPALSASLALERPRRLRMQAALGFTGTEIDLGSNDEHVWFWAKRNEPPAVYFARHLDASSPRVAAILPVPPSWLIEALGLVELDSSTSLQGPLQQTGDTFEVRADVASPAGRLIKVLLIDARFGHILEQTVYDASGRILARARTSRHEYIATAGVALPREIEVQLPTMPLEFRLQVEGYLVNQSLATSPQLWQRPEFPGYPAINLAEAWLR